MQIVGIVLVVLCVVALAAVLWRFVVVRNSGSQGLLRNLPASGVHGWRHGVFRYSGGCLRFYKLRSLAFQRDVELIRCGTEVSGMRAPTSGEREIMPDIDQVLVLRSPQGDFEFASDRHARMALISWLESAPSERQIPRDLKVHTPRVAGGRAHRS